MPSKFEFVSMCASIETVSSKSSHKEIVKQTETNRREDKIAKFVGKTFFFYASEAIYRENNTYNTKGVFQIDKKVQFDYNSCYGKCFEKIRDLENIMQEISFFSVEQDHKTLAANFLRPQIKILF